MKTVNKLKIYSFKIQAQAPVYFGSDKMGELVKDSKGEPILLGNSIGGALRSFLSENGVPEELIKTYMGGVKQAAPEEESKSDESKKEDFVESKIYISDGKIEAEASEEEKKAPVNINTKEGTAIDYGYGSAMDKSKYTLEYLPEGFFITFEVECDIASEKAEKEFDKIIGTWAEGFKQKLIKLGGQQSNGFGSFGLEELKKAELSFDNKTSVKNYIDEFIIYKKAKFEAVSEGTLESYEIRKKQEITFTMEGSFPHGVYQAFVIGKNDDDKEITGLQKNKEIYYIPGSSIKGLIRNQVRLLLTRFIKDAEEVDTKLEKIFGGKEEKGKVVFDDVELSDIKEIKITRYEKDKDNNNSEEREFKPTKEDPVYIKIDRITGGTIERAMKTQREVMGKAALKFKLIDMTDGDEFIFPLIYALRQIGSGYVPIGGRTSIGLGEFEGESIKLDGAKKETYSLQEDLEPDNKELLKKYYNAFEGWCKK